MLANIRYFLVEVVHWIGSNRLVALVAVLGLAGIGVGVYFAITGDSDEPGTITAPPAPQVVVKEEAPAPEQPADLGFPAFATKNTTRVAGTDPIADAAGVALARLPVVRRGPGPRRGHARRRRRLAGRDRGRVTGRAPGRRADPAVRQRRAAAADS